MMPEPPRNSSRLPTRITSNALPAGRGNFTVRVPGRARLRRGLAVVEPIAHVSIRRVVGPCPRRAGTGGRLAARQACTRRGDPCRGGDGGRGRRRGGARLVRGRR